MSRQGRTEQIERMSRLYAEWLNTDKEQSYIGYAVDNGIGDKDRFMLRWKVDNPMSMKQIIEGIVPIDYKEQS